jgi:hypothetical protein
VSSNFILLSNCKKVENNEIINKFFNKNEDYIFFNFQLKEDTLLNGSYQLYRSGKCQYYLYNKYKNKRTVFGGFEDVIVKREWFLFKDSISIMSEKFLYKIEKDTLKLISEFLTKKYSLWKQN